MKLRNCYAHTLVKNEEDQDEFLDCLDGVIRSVSNEDKLFVIVDLNARVGSDCLAWSRVLGSHGMGIVNSNYHRLFSLCARNDLLVTNTAFQPKDIHKGTWTYPWSKHCHMID